MVSIWSQTQADVRRASFLPRQVVQHRSELLEGQSLYGLFVVGGNLLSPSLIKPAPLGLVAKDCEKRQEITRPLAPNDVLVLNHTLNSPSHLLRRMRL